MDGELSELPSDRLSEISALDARAFGSDRSRVLALLSANASISVLSRGGEVVGYSMRREFGRGFVIGPVVARNDHDAVHLTAVHLKKLAGRFVRVDTRERDGVFAEFLQQSGLSIAETVTTMSKGRRFLNREDNGALGLWIGRPRVELKPKLSPLNKRRSQTVDQSARQSSGAMRLPSCSRTWLPRQISSESRIRFPLPTYDLRRPRHAIHNNVADAARARLDARIDVINVSQQIGCDDVRR